MRKKLFAVLLTAALLLTLVPAAQAADPTEGAIYIHMHDSTGASAGNVPADGQEILNPAALGNPVSGITFRVSQVEVVAPQTISTFTVSDAQAFVTANAAKYSSNALYQDSIATGSDGEAKFPSSSSGLTGLPLGVYLVEELAGSGSTTATKPFLVYLPLTLAGVNEDKLLYEVHVYPKSQPLYINKNGNATAANVGEEVTWTIEAAIPANIATLDLTGGGYYIVRDRLDPRLNYVSTAVVISNGPALAENTDYTLIAPDPSDPGYDGGGLVEVRITAAGVDILKNAQAAGKSLQITIVTEINDKALLTTDPSSSTYPMPEPITNSAQLFYKNKGGDPDNPDPGEEPEDPPKVDVTGLTVIKVDGESGALLPGAVFELYWCGEASDSNDPSNYRKVASGTTNQSGYLYWKFDQGFDHLSESNTGVGVGYYYVREIKAPDGYQLLGSISETALLENGDEGYIWRLSNYKLGDDFELPSTGGSGTMLYTVLGVSLIAVGAVCFLLAVRRRRRGQSQ